MKIKSDNYISIQGWMRTELNLSGNDLLVYAIIYSFSQDDESYFNGSLQYLADWCGATKQGILKNIKKLTEKGLIDKDDHGYYANRTVKQSLTEEDESVKLSLTTVKQSLINNIDNKKEKVLSKDNTTEFLGSATKKPKKETMYSKCVALINDFTDDVILQNMLEKCLQMFLTNSRESGMPFYTNTFKGKLNKLKSLSDDNYVQRDIVKQTIDNGWNGFYELKQETKKSVSSDIGFQTKRGDKKSLKEDIENGTAEKF